MIQVSSVAQYERNCYTYPMLKRLADSPGLVGTIGGFMLTASKHKTDLTCSWHLFSPEKLHFQRLSRNLKVTGDDCGVSFKYKPWSSSILRLAELSYLLEYNRWRLFIYMED